MRGCALRVRIIIRIINVAWALGVINYGRAVYWTHPNSPSLLSRPSAIDALPSVSPRVIPLLLPPGGRPHPASPTRVAGALCKDKRFQKHFPPFWPQAKVDRGSFTVLSRSCGGFNSASS